MSRPQSPSALTVPPGRRFGPYVLVRKLAEGGMAEVFLAKLPGASGFERNVVIKRMLRHLSALPDFVDMFQHEAKLAARLAHPNIIHIEELGFVDGYYFICMEYLAGEDFSTVLRHAAQSAGYVPLPVVLRVLVDAAHGLHHAHEFCDEHGRPLGVVHRDVSPSNLFLTYQGQVKVLDFGIAKAGSRITQTGTGVVKGKYSYMAPEQARGDEVDRRADIFALGVSLYEALTQVRPFARDHELAVLNAVLSGKVVPPRQLRPDLPPALEEIVLRALAADPAARYPTAAALAEDLEVFAQAHAALASGAQVAAYLRTAFGEAHLARRSRVPTLASVLDASAAGEDTALELPGAAGAGHRGATAVLPAEAGRDTAVHTAARVATEATAVVRTPVHVTAAAPAARVPPAPSGTRRRWSAVLLGALAGGLLVAGAVLTLGRPLRSSTGEPAGPAVASPAQVAPAAVAPAPPPAAATPSQPEAAVATPPGTARPELALAGPVASGPVLEAARTARPARPRPPVELDEAAIQRVVSRGRAGIEACFERHKEDLTADAGEVRVRLDILRTGRVEAHTQGPLAETAVGRCLEAQVARLRFPAHRDERVTAMQPFAYRVTR